MKKDSETPRREEPFFPLHSKSYGEAQQKISAVKEHLLNSLTGTVWFADLLKAVGPLNAPLPAQLSIRLRDAIIPIEDIVGWKWTLYIQYWTRQEAILVQDDTRAEIFTVLDVTVPDDIALQVLEELPEAYKRDLVENMAHSFVIPDEHRKFFECVFRTLLENSHVFASGCSGIIHGQSSLAK